MKPSLDKFHLLFGWGSKEQSDGIASPSSVRDLKPFIKRWTPLFIRFSAFVRHSFAKQIHYVKQCIHCRKFKLSLFFLSQANILSKTMHRLHPSYYGLLIIWIPTKHSYLHNTYNKPKASVQLSLNRCFLLKCPYHVRNEMFFWFNAFNFLSPPTSKKYILFLLVTSAAKTFLQWFSL